MKVSGFTFVRNGTTFDYPFIESLQSLLPLCDEVIVAVGKSDDDTLERIQSLHSKKIKILQTTWDESLRKNGAILAQQTNIALQHVTGDWAIYLQADEVFHEKDYSTIRHAMNVYLPQHEVEGMLFRYNHFYGSYQYIGDSRKWYRREIRIIRPNIGIQSWGDAQGFRLNGQKVHVKLIDACVYHYGWVKPPAIQQLKQQYFNKLWHPDDWMKTHIADTMEYDYRNGGKLKIFSDTHPAVMHDRVANQYWKFEYSPAKIQRSLKEQLLNAIEKKTGWRVGEYRNYKMI
ncbi:MAG TPA: glycosyltransferase [Bacteroidota bacterium]|nr:glycosyltransferase [Bacteroidota bacterium]